MYTHPNLKKRAENTYSTGRTTSLRSLPTQAEGYPKYDKCSFLIMFDCSQHVLIIFDRNYSINKFD